jgi:DNA-binding MarR family transcriptional regulator
MRPAQQRRRVTELWLQTVGGVVLNNAAVAARLGLGVNDLQVLGLIQRAGRITPGELARMTALTTGSITGVTDRLVAAGYVTRTRDDADRRKVFLGADPAGIARITEHYQHYSRHLEGVLARRGGAELAIISDFLSDLNDLDTLIAPPPR